MKQEELKKVLEQHAKWLRGDNDGTRADLTRANLTGADLRGVNLTGADLTGADLTGADLTRANLTGADLLSLARTEILPREGEVIGWKKCMLDVLVKVRVPAEAARSNATGRKCRAQRVEVLEIVWPDHHDQREVISRHDEETEYVVGQTVECDAWDPCRWNECASGIHFFLTREEAAAY